MVELQLGPVVISWETTQPVVFEGQMTSDVVLL